MDVRRCLDVLAGWQVSYDIQAQVLYRFIVLLIVLILLFRILRDRWAIHYLDLIVG